MKKEVLLSLLMTTPVAFPALAIDLDVNANIDKEGGWQSILAPGVAFTSNPEEFGTNGVKAPAGYARLERVYSNYPKGAYEIAISTDNNCTVTVNGKAIGQIRVQVPDGNGGYKWEVRNGIELTAAGDIKIVVTAKDTKKEFAITSFGFNLIFEKELAEIVASLDNKIEALETISSVKDEYNQSEKAKELRAKETELKKSLKAITDGRALIDSNPFTAYKNYNLYELSGNKLASQLAELAPAIEAYNKAVKDEDARYANNQANKAAYESLAADRNALEANVQNVLVDLGKIEKPNEGQKNLIDMAETLLADVKAFKSTIDTAYADLDKTIDNSKYEAALGQLKATYEKIKALNGEPSEDWKAYEAFNTAGITANKDTSTYRTQYDKVLAAQRVALAKISDYEEEVTGAFAQKYVACQKAIGDVIDAIKAIATPKDGVETLNGKKNCNILELITPEGAVENVEKLEKLLDNAESEFTTLSNDFLANVNAQNEAYEAAMSQIQNDSETGVLDTYEKSVKDVVLPAKFDQTQYKKDCNAVLAAINVLKGLISEAYGNDLSEKDILSDTFKSGFATALEKVNDAQGVLDGYLGEVQKVIEAQKKYDKLVDEVEAADAGRNFLTQLYATNLTAIKNTLDKITKLDNNTDATLKSIDDQIKALNENAAGLIAAFDRVNVQTRYNQLISIIDARNTTLNKANYKKLVDNTNLPGYKNSSNKEQSYKAWAASIESDLAAIIAKHTPETLNRTYNDIVALGEKGYVAAVDVKITEVIAKFINDANDASYNAADGKLKSYKRRIEALTEYGMSNFGEKEGAVAKAEEALGKLSTQKSNANNLSILDENDRLGQSKLTAKLAAGDALDAAVAKFNAETVPALEKAMEKTLANVDAAKALNNALKTADNNIATAKTQLDQLYPANESVYTAVRKVYSDKIKALEDASTAAAKNLKAAAQADKYENSAAAKKEALQAEIAKVADGVLALINTSSKNGAMQNNYDSWAEQVTALDGARAELTNALSHLNEGNKNPDGVGVFNPWKEEYDALALRIDELAKKITASFDKAESEGKNYEIDADAIKADAAALSLKMADEYTAEIMKQNNALLEIWGWTGENGAFTKLENTYTAANRGAIAFQSYENAGWSNYLNNEHIYSATGTTGFGDVRNVLKYYNLKSELNQKLEAYKNSCTAPGKTPVLMDKSKFEDFVSLAGQYTTEINDIYTALDANVREAAEAYYADQLSRANAANTTNETALSAAGILDVTDKIGEDSKKNPIYITNAGRTEHNVGVNGVKAAVNAYKNGAYKTVDFDNIANELDKAQVLKDNQLQTIATNYWNDFFKYYNEDILNKKVNVSVTAMQTAMPTYTLDADLLDKGAGENLVEGNLSKFNKAVGEFNKVNNKLEGEAAMLSKVKENKADLKSKYDAVKRIHDASYAAHKAVLDNATAFENYTKQVNALQTEYDKLRVYAGNLAAANTSYSAVKAKFENLKAMVNGRDYANTANDIKAALAEIPTMLPAAYYSVAVAEKAALYNKYTVVLAALSEASVSDVETFEALQKEVTEFESKKLNKLGDDIEAAYANNEDADAIAALVALGDTMRELETALSNYEIALKATWMEEGTTPLTLVLTELTTKYDEVNEDLTEAIDYLASCHANVQAKFAGTFDACPENLASIKAAWEAAGNNAIMQKGNYVDGMNAIQAIVDEMLPEIQKAQAPIDLNNKVFADRMKEFNKYQGILDDFTALVESSEYYLANGTEEKDEDTDEKYNTKAREYAGKIVKAQDLLDAAKEELDAKNENLSLNNSYSALKGINDIKGMLEELNNTDNILKAFATDEFEGAKKTEDALLKKAAEALKNPNLTPEAKPELQAKLDAIRANIAKLPTDCPTAAASDKTIVETIDAATALYDAVIKDLKEFNDLAFQSTFITGDVNQDAVVDVLDVQQIITIVGEETQDELSEVQFSAADANNDKVIDVTDIAKVINIMKTFGLPQEVVDPSVKRNARAMAGANIITTEFVSEEAGVRRYAINIQNTAAFVAGQLDLVFGEGVTLFDVQVAERAANHNIALFDHGVANKRIVLTNMDNAVINGEAGAVIYVDVLGEGSVNVDNVTFTDRYFNGYQLGKPEGTTGIEDTVIDGNSGMKQRIYNAAGQMLRGIQRGVNIIRNADGSVTKEYHK